MAGPKSWWIARSEHSLVQNVSAPPAVVRDFYVDLDNIKAVHPLVTAVETLAREDAPSGYTQTYRVRDRIPLGPLRLGIAYTATISVPSGDHPVGDVHTDARQFPRVRLTGVVSFEAIEGGTRLTERLAIEAPRPLAAVTVSQAVHAHVDMLAGIAQRFE
jgi:ligand-binding SRPBCC domain-containing protein